MKKLLAIVLAVVMILGCSTVVTLAQTNSKIRPELQEILNSKEPNEFVNIDIAVNKYIEVDDMPSWPDFDKAYIEFREYHENFFRNEIVSVVFDGIEYKEIFVSSGVILVSVKACDIEKIASYDIIREIAYYEIINSDSEGEDIYKGKIEPTIKYLQEYYGPEDMLDVYVWFVGENPDITAMPSWPNYEKSKNELVEFYSEFNKQMMCLAFEDIEYEEIISSKTLPYVIVSLKNSDIDRLAKRDIVAEICNFENYRVDLDKTESYLFETKYREYYNNHYLYIYDELHYHTNNLEQLDWVLMKAYKPMGPEITIFMDIGDVVISSSKLYDGFKFQYGIYDVNNNTFYDLYDLRSNFEKYDGLLDAIKKHKIGRTIGDSDNDGEISVLDATFIQMCIAKIEDFTWDDYYMVYDTEKSGYISDYDGDGAVTVMDATAIQMQLAKIA